MKPLYSLGPNGERVDRQIFMLTCWEDPVWAGLRLTLAEAN